MGLQEGVEKEGETKDGVPDREPVDRVSVPRLGLIDRDWLQDDVSSLDPVGLDAVGLAVRLIEQVVVTVLVATGVTLPVVVIEGVGRVTLRVRVGVKVWLAVVEKESVRVEDGLLRLGLGVDRVPALGVRLARVGDRVQVEVVLGL